MPTSGRNPRERKRTYTYEDLGDVTLTPEEDAMATRKIEEAEQELEDSLALRVADS